MYERLAKQKSNREAEAAADQRQRHQQDGDEPQAADLDEQHKDDLPEQRKGVDDDDGGKPRDAHRARRNKQRIDESDAVMRREGQHQKERADEDDRQKPQ